MLTLGGGSDYVSNVAGFCCQLQQKPLSVCIPPKRGTARFLRTLTQDLLAEVLLGLPLKELQTDLDAWIDYYNGYHTHQGRMRCKHTSLQTLITGKEVWLKRSTA